MGVKKVVSVFRQLAPRRPEWEPKAMEDEHSAKNPPDATSQSFKEHVVMRHQRPHGAAECSAKPNCGHVR